MPTEPASLSTTWTLLAPALGAAGGSTLTLVVGWFILHRTEMYRRAARWEPIAEQLWREKLSSYQQLAAVAIGILCKYSILTPEEVGGQKGGHAYMRLLKLRMKMAPIMSTEVAKAASELSDTFSEWGEVAQELAKVKMLEEAMGKLNALVDAIRTDLGVGALDESAKKWLPKLPASNKSVSASP